MESPNIKKVNKHTIRKFIFKSATYNVTTAGTNEELGLICKELGAAGVTVGGLQETRIPGQGKKVIEYEGGKYEVYYSGKSEKREHGVAICLMTSVHVEFEGVEWGNERMIAVDCRIAGNKFRVISAYAPQNGRPTAEKSDFYHELEKLIVCKDRHRKPLLLGDFNSFCSAFHGNCNFSGKHVDQLGDYESHESGDLFIDFCEKMGLSSLATFFDHKWTHRATHYNNNGLTVRVYDHVLASDWLRKFTRDCRVRNNVQTGSDHRCVIAVHAVPRFRRDRARTKKKRSLRVQKVNTDYSMLRKDENIENMFAQEFRRTIAHHQNPTVDHIQSCIEKASEVIPIKQPDNRKHRPWDSDVDLCRLIQERRQVNRKESPFEFKKYSKQIKKRVSVLRNHHLENVAVKINTTWKMRELEKMYALTKNDGYGCDSDIKKQCSESDLVAHFEKQFNYQNDMSAPEEISTNIPECLSDLSQIEFNSVNLHDGVPTVDELTDSIKKLKNNRSSTDVQSECLKSLVDDPVFMRVIHSAISQIWETLEIPMKWRVSRIVALFKKGDTSLASNYRGLSVSSVILKAAILVILNRQKQWYESTIDDCQNGFRDDRGTIDSIMIIQSLNRISKAKGEQIYCLALDLRSAYDWIKRSWLWLNMKARTKGADYENDLDGLYKIIREIYNETYAYLGDEKTCFRTTSGVLQGAVDSPAHFSVFFDSILRIFIEKCQKRNIHGVKFDYRIPSQASTRAQRMQDKLNGTRSIFYGGYCDDVFVTCSSLDDLKAATEILEDVCGRFGLTICCKKTKTMILNYKEPKTTPKKSSTNKKRKKSKKKSKYPTNLVKIGGQVIENVSIFKYLGVKIDKSDYRTGKSEINYRISCANFKFYKMKHIFQNKSIKMKVRMIYYNAYIRTRLTYGSQLWNLPFNLRGKIQKVHTKHLRTMAIRGFERRGGPSSLRDEIGYNWKWVYRYNDLLKICRTDPVLDFTDFQRAKWISHVIRKNNDSAVKQLLFEVSQTTRIGRTTSSLDQLLDVTRQYDISDTTVYKTSVTRDFVSELKDRDVEFIPKHHGDSDEIQQENLAQ